MWTLISITPDPDLPGRNWVGGVGICQSSDLIKKRFLDYQPLVIETLGAMAPAACQTLRSLNRLVADNTETPIAEVARRFWQRMSIDLQRAMRRAYVRRVVTPMAGNIVPAAFRLLASSVLQEIDD